MYEIGTICILSDPCKKICKDIRRIVLVLNGDQRGYNDHWKSDLSILSPVGAGYTGSSLKAL